MKTGGIHILLDVVNCQVALNNVTKTKDIVKNIADFCRVKIVNIATHNYHPTGVSVVALLLESHISLHTWPLEKFVSVDIYSCGDYDIKYVKLKKIIEDKLQGQATLLLIKREKGKIKVVTEE